MFLLGMVIFAEKLTTDGKDNLDKLKESGLMDSLSLSSNMFDDDTNFLLFFLKI